MPRGQKVVGFAGKTAFALRDGNYMPEWRRGSYYPNDTLFLVRPWGKIVRLMGRLWKKYDH